MLSGKECHLITCCVLPRLLVRGDGTRLNISMVGVIKAFKPYVCLISLSFVYNYFKVVFLSPVFQNDYERLLVLLATPNGHSSGR